MFFISLKMQIKIIERQYKYRQQKSTTYLCSTLDFN